MAARFGVPRSVILERVGIEAEYADEDLPSVAELLHAAEVMDRIKRDGLDAV